MKQHSSALCRHFPAALIITKFVASFFIIVLALPLFSCTKKLETRTLTLIRNDNSTVRIKAEMARTDEERANGFMRRKKIPDGTGMLFLFDRDQRLSFWMKDTPHALSSAFIDAHGRIRDIFNMTPFSLANVNSTVSVRYALEVPQGWFEKMNISIDDELVLDFDVRAE